MKKDKDRSEAEIREEHREALLALDTLFGDWSEGYDEDQKRYLQRYAREDVRMLLRKVAARRRK